MYLNFFNLKKEPFNTTPDPELLFLSPSHKEALAAVIYGVRQRKGFIAITGEVGVGKTTIIRSFLNMIYKKEFRTIYVFNANISFKALLKTIFQNLGHVLDTDSVPEMVNRLHMILIDEYKAGRNVVLIIDEVQNMPVETLENLRMLSNLETSTDKLIQIVLCGQPEFEEKITLHALRQLRQRIAIKVKIMPLSREECRAYINHRLSRTATKEPDIFTRGALRRIVREGGGIPRIINILCDNCLITSFGNQQKKVTAKVAREIIADLRGESRGGSRWIIASLASLAVALCALWVYWNNGLPAPGPEAITPVRIPIETVAEKRGIRDVQPASVNTGEEQGREAKIKDEPEKGDIGVRRVVRRGETLAGLVRETYGSVDRELIELVKKNNPDIANIDVIQEGEKLYFPPRGK